MDLMSGEWAKDLGCNKRAKAQLPGYARAFNKKSVRNWGSKQSPCPTLNVIESTSSSCWGIAFQFSDHRKQDILTLLKAREGKDFVFQELSIELEDGVVVEATVSVYQGDNVVAVQDMAQITKMVLDARGKDGTCIRYVQDVADKLRQLGIDDPVVSGISSAVMNATSYH